MEYLSELGVWKGVTVTFNRNCERAVRPLTAPDTLITLDEFEAEWPEEPSNPEPWQDEVLTGARGRALRARPHAPHAAWLTD